jgi:hypothetical protein
LIDESFYFIISVDVNWLSSESNLLRVINLERAGNKFKLDACIACEDVAGVNLS